MNSTAGWFETRGKFLFVWEGVCALKTAVSLTLLKVGQNEEILEISLNESLLHFEITSEGYWQCVEIRGEFSDGSFFYYHADCPRKSLQMIERVLRSISSDLSQLSLRLDDDPLRIGDKKTNISRLYSWLKTVVGFFPSPKLIIDRNMPL